MELNIEENRKVQNYSKLILLKRVLWSFAKVLFRNSPRTAFGFRNFLLRSFGASIGKSVHIYASATITFPWNLEVGDWSAIGENTLIYSVGKIVIGEKVTISQNSHLCAASHDYRDVALPIITAQVTVCDQAWVAADVFVAPGVTVGKGAILGSRCVMTKDAEEWGIYAGNPARFIKKRELKNN